MPGRSSVLVVPDADELDHVPGRGVAEEGHQRFSGKVGL